MLVVRAPMRISFGGGGTDLEAYSAHHGGIVLSTTINRYCYVILTPGDPDGVQISSSDMRVFDNRPADFGAGEAGDEAAGDLPLPWAVLRYFGIRRGLNLFLASEIPPGTGLGSSSALTVALVRALATLVDHPLSRYQVAEIASQIEIHDLGWLIGRQDQYAAAFGGLNLIRFAPAPADGAVTVTPLDLPADTRRHLEQHLMLFFTGAARNSAGILHQQRQATHEAQAPVLAALDGVKALALEMQASLLRGDLPAFGGLLDAAWQHKKHLAGGITTPTIDTAYATARAAGAWGGKITGAGGGGFLLVCCPPVHQAAVTAALRAQGLRRMSFRFDRKGATVLLNHGDLDVSGRDYASLLKPLRTWARLTDRAANGAHPRPAWMPGDG